MTRRRVKKNPLLSLYLQGVNRMAGIARGYATAEANRQRTALVRHAGRFWSEALLPAAKPKRKR